MKKQQGRNVLRTGNCIQSSSNILPIEIETIIVKVYKYTEKSNPKNSVVEYQAGEILNRGSICFFFFSLQLSGKILKISQSLKNYSILTQV